MSFGVLDANIQYFMFSEIFLHEKSVYAVLFLYQLIILDCFLYKTMSFFAIFFYKKFIFACKNDDSC